MPKKAEQGALPPAAVERLVVFRALQLGDMLCAVPALRSIRAGFPAARITLVGLPWAEQFARRFPAYVDEFVPFPGHPALPEQPARPELLPDFYAELRRRRFDLALQMHGSGRVSNGIVAAFGARAVAGFHAGRGGAGGGLLPYPRRGHEAARLSALARFLGLPERGSELEFPLTAADHEELRASGLAAGLAPGSYVCIHPGARSRDKCWPAQRFAEVGDRIAGEFGLPVVLTGSGAERDLTAAVAGHMRHPAVDAAAPISVGAMAALIRGARLLVCNDTGVSHIAAGLGLPSVVVFSRSDMGRWGPADRRLHPCVRDPGGRRAATVYEHARRLLRR